MGAGVFCFLMILEIQKTLRTKCCRVVQPCDNFGPKNGYFFSLGGSSKHAPTCAILEAQAVFERPCCTKKQTAPPKRHGLVHGFLPSRKGKNCKNTGSGVALGGGGCADLREVNPRHGCRKWGKVPLDHASAITLFSKQSCAPYRHG